jgi:hypothetical protein
MDGPVAHILSGGILIRTLACPVPDQGRHRLGGARRTHSAPACPPGHHRHRANHPGRSLGLLFRGSTVPARYDAPSYAVVLTGHFASYRVSPGLLAQLGPVATLSQ